MATERIDIVISETGSRVVERRLGDLGNKAKQTAGNVNLLNKALSTISVGVLAAQLISLSDTYTNLQNRLKTVTSSSQELVSVTKELTDIANSTGQSFSATTETYTRLSTATESLGLSTKELLQFTTSLNQAVALSGATSTEASSALIQLSQGLGAGALRGQELLSVLEQLPTVADIIAKGIGVTRGELKLLGEEGKITANEVVKAFSKAEQELSGNFSKSARTIGQSFTILNNELIVYIGNLDKSLGISSTFSKLLITISENVDVLVRSLGALGLVLGAIALRAAATAAAAAVIAAPFNAIAIAIAGVVSALVVFSDKIKIGKSDLTSLGDVAVESFNKITNLSSKKTILEAADDRAFIRSLDETFAKADEIIALNSNKKIGTNITSPETRAFQNSLNDLKKEEEALKLNTNQRKIRKGILEAEDQLKRKLTDTEKAAYQQQLIINQALESQNKIYLEIKKPINDYTENLSALNTLLANGKITSSEYNIKLQEITSSYRNSVAPFSEIIKNIEKEQALLRISTTQREIALGVMQAESQLQRNLTSNEKSMLEQQLKLTQSLENQARVLESIRQPTENYKNDLSALGLLLNSGSITLDEYNIKVNEITLAYKATQEPFSVMLENLKREEELLKLTTKERQVQLGIYQAEDQLKRSLTETERSSLEQQIQKNQALEEQSKLLNDIRGPSEEYGNSISNLNKLLSDGKINFDEYKNKSKELSLSFLETQNGFEAGIQRGVLKVSKNVQDIASQAERLVTNAFNSMEDALVDFVKTGKLNFKSLVDSILADIIRIQVRQAISSAFSAFNVGSSILSFAPKFFAKGDVFSGPTAFSYGKGNLGVLGEAGDEAVMPLKRMRDGSLGVHAVSSGNATNISNNVTLNYTAAPDQRSESSQDSKRIIQLVQQGIEQSMGEFLRKQQKVGGMLNSRVSA